MQVDRQQLMEHGYIILRNVIPPALLEPLRAGVEQMVSRRKEISIQRRTPAEPPGGEWEARAQPRLKLETDCDAESAPAVEILLHEHTLGVARQLIEAPHVSLHNLACLCNPERDAGPAGWHRDLRPGEPAPLRGMIANMQAHGPSYLQWNIPLYDDRVLWIVPGSHRRVNTEEENRQLAENPRLPLPGSIPVELNAGDGVVYTHLLLHCGSNYTQKLRRTLHPGYRPFGFASLPNVHWRHWEPGFFHLLSPGARQRFAEWDQLFLAELGLIAQALHAIIRKDAPGFLDAFHKLHPSPREQLVSLVMLSKLADRVYRLKQMNQHPSGLWGTARDMVYLGTHFTPEQARDLWQRFGALDKALRTPAARPSPGFQGSDATYERNEMPADFSVDDFIASWGQT